MTDSIERLRLEGSPLERAVIESASVDAMPADARARLTAAVLGSAAVAGAGAVKLGVAGAGNATAKGVLAMSLKWGAMVTLALGFGVGVFAIHDRRRDPVVSAPVVAAPADSTNVGRVIASEQTDLPAPPRPVVPDVPPAASSGRALSLEMGAPAPGRSARTAGSSRPSTSSVQDEIRRIDDARSALEQGDPRGAISRLDSYSRAFPAGAFWQEAAVLRVDAYLASGDRDAAARAAAAFVHAHSDSPYAVRLRALAKEVDKDAAPTKTAAPIE